MSIKYKYKNDNERLKIIIQNQGKSCIENKDNKYIEYCEAGEIVENNKIIQNENYINELKEQKIKDLCDYLLLQAQNNIENKYNIKIDLNQPLTIKNLVYMNFKLDKSFNEIFEFLEQMHNYMRETYNNMKKQILKLKTIEEINNFDFINKEKGENNDKN